MRRFNRVVPWRDFELLRLLFTHQQGSLAQQHAELPRGWEKIMVLSTQITGNYGLPESLSVPSIFTHRYFAGKCSA